RDMGTTDTRPSGLLLDLLDGDGQPELDESRHHALVAGVTSSLEPHERLLERSLTVLHEVDEQVHGAAVDLAGDLASRHELDPELGGAGAGRGYAVEAVVVGEGD